MDRRWSGCPRFRDAMDYPDDHCQSFQRIPLGGFARFRTVRCSSANHRAGRHTCHLVAATPRHVWRLEAWHGLFPEARVWVTRHTPATLESRNIPSRNVLDDKPDQDWAGDIDQLIFRGNPLIEEAVFFHRESGTAILDDLVQTHPAVKGKPLRNTFFRLAGVLYPGYGVPFDIRLSFIHRKIARQSLGKLLSWDFDRLIIAHGPCIEKDAKSVVEEAFDWL